MSWLSQPRKQRIREELKRQRRRRAITLTAIVGILTTIAVVGIVLSQRPQQPAQGVGTAISPELYRDLSGVSDSTLLSVGSGQGVTPPTPVTGSPLTSDGKPLFLYIGADYCPYCAAERWSIIVALSRFGNFSGLTYMLSGPAPEPDPSTSTFSFHGSTYSSQYVAFTGVEEQDRFRNPLQTPTTDQQNIMNQYDSKGQIPFIDIGNQYVFTGSQYSPDILSGLNWTQIGLKLNDPSSLIAKSIDGAANTLITSICKVDGGAPSSVCGQSFANLSLAPPALGQLSPSNQFDPSLISDRIEAPSIGKTI